MVQVYVLTEEKYPTELHVWQLASGTRACAVYIHGGTLIGGQAHEDCSKALVECCEELDITLYSIEYRLFPANSEDIRNDICEVENWLSREQNLRGDNVIVILASAAALPGFETVNLCLL